MPVRRRHTFGVCGAMAGDLRSSSGHQNSRSPCLISWKPELIAVDGRTRTQYDAPGSTELASAVPYSVVYSHHRLGIRSCSDCGANSMDEILVQAGSRLWSMRSDSRVLDAFLESGGWTSREQS